jgi:type I restriction enzyme, S subunit
MSEFPETTLASLVYDSRPITYGIVQPGPDVSPDGIPLIRGKDYSSGKVATSGLYHVLPAIDLPYSRSKVRGGDLLLSIVGYVGQVAQVPEELSGANITQTTARISVDPTKADSKFLFQYLSAPHFRPEMTRYEKGSAQPGLNLSDVQRLKIRCPAISQQRRIAEILSTVDEAIAQTEALIAKYSQIKAGLMHELFTCGVTPDGHLRSPQPEASQLYKQSPLGWIPKEWEVVRTEECAANVPGATTIGPFGSDLISSDYRNEGVPVVFVRDVKEDHFEWKSNVYVSPEKADRLRAHKVKAGDLLATKMGLPPCVSCRYPEWMEDGVITADIVRLRPDTAKINARWLSAALNSHAFKKQVEAITAGVTRPKVTLSDYRNLRLARPRIGEQDLIAARLASFEGLILSETNKLAKLRQQKQGLMHDLLTGHVPVAERKEN